MNFSLIYDNLGFFGKAAIISIVIFVSSVFFSVIISLVLGSLASVRLAWVRLPVRLFVELFRDVPQIVTLFFIFFGMPYFGLQLGAIEATIVCLSLWGGANGAEIVRGSICAVPKHQFESSRALGLSSLTIFRSIIVPQAIRPIIPAYVGLCSILLHSTSLGTLIGATELLHGAQIVIERSAFFNGGMPGLTIYTFILIVYYIAGCAFVKAGEKLERRLSLSTRRN